MASSGYEPLPSGPGVESDPPPAYTAEYKGPSQPVVGAPTTAYAGSYQGGEPYGVYPGAPSIPAGYQQSQQTTSYVHLYQPAPSVIVIGGCPACRVGVLEDEYSCLGIFCAIVFFPLGILCCLAMKQRHCPNCGAVFG